MSDNEQIRFVVNAPEWEKPLFTFLYSLEPEQDDLEDEEEEDENDAETERPQDLEADEAADILREFPRGTLAADATDGEEEDESESESDSESENEVRDDAELSDVPEIDEADPADEANELEESELSQEMITAMTDDDAIDDDAFTLDNEYASLLAVVGFNPNDPDKPELEVWEKRNAVLTLYVNNNESTNNAAFSLTQAELASLTYVFRSAETPLPALADPINPLTLGYASGNTNIRTLSVWRVAPGFEYTGHLNLIKPDVDADTFAPSVHIVISNGAYSSTVSVPCTYCKQIADALEETQHLCYDARRNKKG